MTKFVVFVGLAMTMVGCNSLVEKDTQTKVLTKHVGWFYDRCLVIKAPNLPMGTVVTLVDVEATKNMLRSKIIAPAKNADECSPLADDRKDVNSEDGKSFYLISKPTQAETTFNFGIAVVLDGQNDSLPILETFDLNNDGTLDSFSFCATSEGISFDVWSATPYKSKNIWNGYYYLGYDIESNCPER
ncbi:MAG: hypothetical protein GXP14_05470 [Gammaproteobacteria bacterium]|nr:hypothetical protein [Gammaproteobacteria bacterium]